MTQISVVLMLLQVNVTNEKKRLETYNEGQEKQDKSSGAVKCSQV